MTTPLPRVFALYPREPWFKAIDADNARHLTIPAYECLPPTPDRRPEFAPPMRTIALERRIYRYGAGGGYGRADASVLVFFDVTSPEENGRVHDAVTRAGAVIALALFLRRVAAKAAKDAAIALGVEPPCDDGGCCEWVCEDGDEELGIGWDLYCDRCFRWRRWELRERTPEDG